MFLFLIPSGAFFRRDVGSPWLCGIVAFGKTMLAVDSGTCRYTSRVQIGMCTFMFPRSCSGISMASRSIKTAAPDGIKKRKSQMHTSRPYGPRYCKSP